MLGVFRSDVLCDGYEPLKSISLNFQTETMFFIFSKILSFLFTPLVWILAVFIYGLKTKVETRRKKCLWSSLIMLLFFTNSAIYNVFMHAWEVAAVKDSEINETYDAAIVLGGVLNYDPAMDKIQFNRSTDRIMHAIDLFYKGKVHSIVFTDGSGSLLHQEFKEADHMKKYLNAIGIPDSCVTIESESKNTHENAMNIKPILQKKFPKGKFLLITSAYHMRRSLGCFKVAGIAVTPYSTERMSGPWRWDLDFLFLPKVEIMECWDTLLHEVLGEIMYKLAGYS